MNFKYFGDIILITGLTAIIIVVTAYSSIALANLTVGKGDTDERHARSWLEATTIGGWIMAVVSGLLLAALIVGTFTPEGELASTFIPHKAVSYIMLVLLIFFILQGIFLLIAAGEIRNGTLFGSNRTEYNHVEWAGVIAVVIGGGTMLAKLIIFAYDKHKKHVDKHETFEDNYQPYRTGAKARRVGRSANRDVVRQGLQGAAVDIGTGVLNNELNALFP